MPVTADPPHDLVIALLDVTPEARADALRALLPPGFRLVVGHTAGEAAMAELIADADFAIAGQVAVPGNVLRAATRLRLLHKWGVGVDNLDLETAAALGIPVARTTGSNALPVAEFTIGMMLAALRHSAYGHHRLKGGVWHGPAQLPGRTALLSGKTVGIIGLGAIGQQLARLLQGFGCEVLYTKRTPLSPDDEARLQVTHTTLPDLLARADIVSLHCPLTPQTANMIDAAAFARMKRTAILVNAARGGVVVEADLITALKAGVIAGAAMDVFETEPLPADSPLLALDNLVVTPHLASAASDTFEPTVRRIFANCVRVAKGEPIPDDERVV
jgi:phosphoglycerate dehydrogenase-like enzyme